MSPCTVQSLTSASAPGLGYLGFSVFHHLFDYARADLEEAAVQLAYIELEEEKIAEKRQRGLPSLPARHPRFPQPPISAVSKSSSDWECGSWSRGWNIKIKVNPTQVHGV